MSINFYLHFDFHCATFSRFHRLSSCEVNAFSVEVCCFPSQLRGRHGNGEGRMCLMGRGGSDMQNLVCVGKMSKTRMKVLNE